jgi:TonB family protein
MMATIRQPIGARGGAVRPGCCFVLALGLALAGGCAHETAPPPAADGPTVKAGTSSDKTTEDLIDGPRWQYDRYFDAFIERVRRNWSDEGAAHALGAERPGRVVSTVVLRVVLLTNGRLRRAGVEKLSGSPRYDELAVRAIDAGQPFAPPGPELARDGLLSFRLEVRFDARTGKATFRARRP